MEAEKGIMPPSISTKKKTLFNITNPGIILVLWDILFGLPIAYFLTYLNAHIFHTLGYDKFMRSPGGVRFSRALFTAINVWLVVGWAWQLMQEVKERKEENLRVLREQIAYWDVEIERLSRVLDAKQIEKQLMHDRIREGSESGYVQEKRMVIVDGKIRWRKGMKETVASTEGLDGLASWKKGLREPSVFYRP